MTTDARIAEAVERCRELAAQRPLPGPMKGLADHPGYEVSADGTIRSPRGRALIAYRRASGYMTVNLLTPRGKHVLHYVHRLVAEAHVPNPLALREVNHLDGNPSHNGATNLEWCTHTGNQRHASRLWRKRRQHGTQPGNR